MSEIGQNIEQENQPELSEQEACDKFWKILKEEGWMTIDGEDHCADCWERYKKLVKEAGNERFLEDNAVPTSRLVKYRRLRDAFAVDCYGPGREETCPENKSVTVPFKEES